MPLEVFYSYSHKDSILRDELQVHLAQLTRDGLIVGWADRCLLPGDGWRMQIDEHVRSAQIVLLLVSPDFLASDYCYGIELKIAMDRHAAKQAVVIPIILRPADWRSTPFAELQALPQDGKAVTLWPNRDEVLAQIAQSIREVAVRFQKPVPKPEFSALFDRQIPQGRVLDAAMPSHVLQGKATEMQAMIRLPDSPGLAGVLQLDEEAEARPEDVRSKPFEVTFPFDVLGRSQPLKVAMQVTSPDFTPASQTKSILVPVNGDSQVCGFFLTPIRTGSLLVMIELTWEDIERGYRRLKTTCVSESALPANPVMTLVQMEVGVGVGGRLPAPAAFGAAVGSAQGAPPWPRDEPTMMAPPPPPAPRVAAASPSRMPSKSGVMSSPALKVAAALCVFLVGSSYFWFQNAGGSARPPINQSAVPPPKAAVAPALEERLQTASIELAHASKQPAQTPLDATAIKEGARDLAAARVALGKGDRVEARKHLAAVESINRRLAQRAIQSP